MTKSALLNASDSANGDIQPLITISLLIFAAVPVLLIAFLLGGYVGFLIGKWQRHRSEEARPANANAHDMKALARGKDRSVGPRKDGWKQLVVVRDESKSDKNDAGDGPTMVLRGSLDLMASKWGNGDTKKSSLENNCVSASNINVPPAAASSALVKYLSPDSMMELLFSNAGKMGTTTICQKPSVFMNILT